jgi:ABC-type histidine transport system ATPase subunit
MYTYDQKVREKDAGFVRGPAVARGDHTANAAPFNAIISALAPELVGEGLPVIRQIGREHDLTMLMVTHQMGLAKEFSGRVCSFYQDKIAEQGQPKEAG